MTDEFRTGNVYDDAVLSWADNELKKMRKNDKPPVSVYFGYEIVCYSSWTCDYDVTATIVRSDGSEVRTMWAFGDVLQALPEYVAAEKALAAAHEEYHGD